LVKQYVSILSWHNIAKEKRFEREILKMADRSNLAGRPHENPLL